MIGIEKRSDFVYFVILVLIPVYSLLGVSLSGLTLPPGDIATEIADELELRGHLFTGVNCLPHTGGQLRELFASADTSGWGDFTTLSLWWLASLPAGDTLTLWLEPGIRSVSNMQETEGYGEGRVGVAFEDGIFAGEGTYRIDQIWLDDPSFVGMRWGGVAGRAEQSYLSLAGKSWRFVIGKEYHRWGSGLMLNDVCPSVEGISFRKVFWNHIELSSFLSFLDDYVIYPDATGDTMQTGIYVVQRYLAGHRLELYGNKWSLGISEVVVYGGVGRSPELYYTLPFYWFQAEQDNRFWDDNTLVGIDGRLVLAPVRIKGELLIDDYQIEHQVQADEEPAEVAWTLSTELGLSRSTLYLSYEGVTNRTYNQHKPWNRYIYQNRYIGSFLGNDADCWSVGCRFFPSTYLWGDGNFSYIRNGEGSVTAPWSEPWMNIDGAYSEPFPTGIIERTMRMKLILHGVLWRNRLSWTINSDFSKVENSGHIQGKRENEWSIILGLKTYFHIKGNRWQFYLM